MTNENQNQATQSVPSSEWLGDRMLEEYLKTNFEKGIIDHAIRAEVDAEGRVSFYIHPHGHDGETLDFWVWENALWDKQRMHPDEVMQTIREAKALEL